MPDERTPERRPLPVINENAKVEQLRQQAGEFPPTPEENGNVVIKADSPKAQQVATQVIDVIRTIYDPEIPLSIYDLGLIYRIDVHAETCAVEIKMTLTAPGCPVAGSLVAEVERKVENLDAVPSAVVELVWDPPWDRSRMSEAALLQLGLL